MRNFRYRWYIKIVCSKSVGEFCREFLVVHPTCAV